MSERHDGGDFAFGAPGSDGAAMAAAGLTFVVRYLNYPGAGGKQLTALEVADFHAHGIAICTVFESTAGRALEGFSAGAWDAQAALTAMRALGIPEDRPAYFAIDTDTNPSQFAAIGEYFRGVASVMSLQRTGVYGEYEVLVWLYENKLAAWFWQCLAWSGGRMFEYRHMYQYTPGMPFNGHLMDYDYAYGDDFGQWPVEDDMALQQELQDFKLAVFGPSIGETGQPALEYAQYRIDQRIGKASDGSTSPILEQWLGNLAAAVTELADAIGDTPPGPVGPDLTEIRTKLANLSKELREAGASLT